MAEYNPNYQKNENIDSTGYINFDQFVAQNNLNQFNPYAYPQITNTTPYLGSNSATYYYPSSSADNVAEAGNLFVNTNQIQFPPTFLASNVSIENSKLTPTAIEFVPRRNVQHFESNFFDSYSDYPMNNSQGLEFDSDLTNSSNPNTTSYTPPKLNNEDINSSNSNRNEKLDDVLLSSLDLNATTQSNTGTVRKQYNVNKKQDPKSVYRNEHVRKYNYENGAGSGRLNYRNKSYPDRDKDRERYRSDDRYNSKDEKKRSGIYDFSSNDYNNYRSSKYKQENVSSSQQQGWIRNEKENNSPIECDDNIYRNERYTKSKIHPEFKINRNLKSSPEQTLLDTEQCSQRDKLIFEIDNGRLECLVCCENIKPFQSTWSCSNCYHILHLNCTVKWAASSKSEEGWRCPACQNITLKVPRDYYCFCGKLKNPQYNRNDVAHSCGELCGRKDGCEHPCNSLCHPGRCNPCQASVVRSCGCGRSKKSLQCNQKEEIICEAICDKLLNCGIHRCKEICHTGNCTECDETIEHQCFCGKNKKMVTCTKENNSNRNYSCTKSCNKKLSCNHHKCTKTCHKGDCGECKLSPNVITSCPCGKLPIPSGQRKSCLEPVPLCGGVCSKPLKCGPPASPHLCISKCHNGNCPPCNKSTSVKCRCGHMDQMIKCRQLTTRADDARCKKRCSKKRNCGKHKCNQECCIDIDHICPLPCTFTLSCGKHKCNRTCHIGKCDPCHRTSFQELHCECGASIIYPPVPCGTKKPLCDKPCTRQHPCDHKVLHNCHSAQNCPPCMILTTQFCHGKHEQRKTIPCSQGEFSCGMPCNKQLPCGRHKCIKICHNGPCIVDDEQCKQNCPKPRVMCGHKCNAPCHEDECPSVPCKENVEVTCQCGNRKQTRTCYDFASDYRRIVTAQLASSMQEMQRGNSIDLCDILGPVKISNNRTLDCNDECRLLERNRRLAIGLQIRNPDLPSKLQPRYSDFLRGWAKKDPIFMKNIHDRLTDLVKLAKESKQKSRSHSFPTMNREKRQVVHEMCGMFGVESVAYDAEPNRNVVATAHKEKSWLPGMSILEVLQRENGQRRVPLPNGIKRN